MTTWRTILSGVKRKMAEKTTNRVDGAAMKRDTKATLTGHAADMTIVFFFTTSDRAKANRLLGTT
jgi:hypothetical protein